MTEKRFKKGYCCGDTGLIDNKKEEWFVENINSISDLERNWNDVLNKLNEVADENEQLKQTMQDISVKKYNKVESVSKAINKVEAQNEKLANMLEDRELNEKKVQKVLRNMAWWSFARYLPVKFAKFNPSKLIKLAI